MVCIYNFYRMVTFINHTVPERTWIGFGGFYDNTPIPFITAIRVKVGGVMRRMWDLSRMHTREVPELFLEPEEQLIVEEGKPLLIEAYASNTGTAKLGIYGYVGEQAGKKIQR